VTAWAWRNQRHATAQASLATASRWDTDPHAADDARRMPHDYVRNGTTSLFAAFDVGSGSVIAQPYRHRHQEFLKFLKLIDSAVPNGLDLHLVLDNYATDKMPAIHQWLLKHPPGPACQPSPSGGWLRHELAHVF
jgi:hypothetical protein